MKAKISKAQIEVWEWKENLSKELLKIPKNERLKHIREKVKKTVERIRSKKKKSLV